MRATKFMPLLGCILLLGGCYNSGDKYAFKADAPPPPIVMPDTPREKITTLTLDSYQVAALEPSSGQDILAAREFGCKKPGGDVLGYQWGKNSVGMKVGRDATVRYRLSLGEDAQFKRPCVTAKRWHGYARGVFE